MFEIERCKKEKMFLCTVCHLCKEPGLTHQATAINLTAMHMHMLSNHQLQWQPPNFLTKPWLLLTCKLKYIHYPYC